MRARSSRTPIPASALILATVALAIAATTIRCGTIRSSAQTREYQVINLMPLFWEAWEEVRGLVEEKQIEVIWRRVVQARPEIYNSEVFRRSRRDGVPGGAQGKVCANLR